MSLVKREIILRLKKIMLYIYNPIKDLLSLTYFTYEVSFLTQNRVWIFQDFQKPWIPYENNPKNVKRTLNIYPFRKIK